MFLKHKVLKVEKTGWRPPDCVTYLENVEFFNLYNLESLGLINFLDK